MARLGQQSNRYRAWYLGQIQKKQPYYNTSALRVASRSYLGYSSQVVRGERGPDGVPGPQGGTGTSFDIKYTFNSLALLLAATPAEFPSFSLVAGSLDQADEDYGKLYYYHDGTSGWQFVADMSIQGVEGNSMLSGNGSPSTSLGKDGDLYIDLTAKELYGPRTTVGQTTDWGTPVSLQGDQGTPGTGGGTWTGDIDMDGYNISNIDVATTTQIDAGNIQIATNTIESIAGGSAGDIQIMYFEGFCSDSNYYVESSCIASGICTDSQYDDMEAACLLASETWTSNNYTWTASKQAQFGYGIHLGDNETAGIITTQNNSDRDIIISPDGTGNLRLKGDTIDLWDDTNTYLGLRVQMTGGEGIQISNSGVAGAYGTGSITTLKTYAGNDLAIQSPLGLLSLYAAFGLTLSSITPSSYGLVNSDGVIGAVGIASVTITSSTADHTPGTYTDVPLVNPNSTENGYGAQATVIVAGDGSITSVTVTAPGMNYRDGVFVEFHATIGGVLAAASITLESFSTTWSNNAVPNVLDNRLPTIASINQYINDRDWIRKSEPTLLADMDCNSHELTEVGNISMVGDTVTFGSSTNGVDFKVYGSDADEYMAWEPSLSRIAIYAKDPQAQLWLQNDDNDGTNGPAFTMYRNSTTPAAGDDLGLFTYKGQNSNGQTQNYARLTAGILSPTHTAEKGKISFRVASDGQHADLTNGIVVKGTDTANVAEVDIGGHLNLKDITLAPGTPSAGYGSVYVIQDQLYFKDDAGNDTKLDRDFLDEDDLATDSETSTASQQSIKAYVDANVGAASTSDVVTALNADLGGDFTIGNQSNDTAILTGDMQLKTDSSKISLGGSGTEVTIVHATDSSINIKALVTNQTATLPLLKLNRSLDAPDVAGVGFGTSIDFWLDSQYQPNGMKAARLMIENTDQAQFSEKYDFVVQLSTGVAPSTVTEALRLTDAGDLTVTGDVAGSNLSGTNTGDGTYGIADTNYVKVDGSPATNNFTVFTGDGIKGLNYSSVKFALGITNVTNDAQLPLSGGIMSGDVTMAVNDSINFDGAGGAEYIFGDGTDLALHSDADLNLTATDDVNIPGGVGLTFGADTEKIEATGLNALSLVSLGSMNLTCGGQASINLTSGKDITIDAAGTLTLTGSTSIEMTDKLNMNENEIEEVQKLTFKSGGVSKGTVSAFLDENDMLSDDHKAVASQQSIKAYVDSRDADGYDHIMVTPADFMPSDAASTYNLGVYDFGSGYSYGALRAMTSVLEFFAYKVIPKGYKATSIDIWLVHKFASDTSTLTIYEKSWDDTAPAVKGTLSCTGTALAGLYQLDFTDITATDDNLIMIKLDPWATSTHFLGAKIYITEV